MKRLGLLGYGLLICLLALLLFGTVNLQARASGPVTSVSRLDYDCDGEITVNDVLIVVAHWGDQTPVDLWAYDLTGDGVIDVDDAYAAADGVGAVVVQPPLWCQERITYGAN